MLNVLLAAATLGLFAVAMRVWVMVIQRLTQRLPLVDRDPYNAVPWGLLDVVLGIGMLFTFSMLAISFVNRQFDVTAATPPETLSLSYYRWNISGQALASLATLVTVAGMMVLRYRMSPRDWGLVFPTVWRDLRLGAGAFLVLAPPTYALQLLLIQWVDSKHPIVELLREHPDPGLIAASVGSAVLVAPIFEEFLFRGLLQGWLEKLVAYSSQPGQPTLGGIAETARQGRAIRSDEEAEADSQPSDAGNAGLDNPYSSPAAPIASSPGDSKSDQSAVPKGFNGYLPILASSALFAALHVSHGPDWVPLFFLALGLGYLYRQTHRLLPCITVHFLLNSCSMGMFLIELFRS